MGCIQQRTTLQRALPALEHDHMISYIVVLIIAIIAGCGGLEPVSKDFEGVWYGEALVQPVNVGEFSYTMLLSSAVASDTTAVFDSMCPDFGGQMIARGEGQSVSWEGEISCAPHATSLCEAVTLTFTEATFNLGDAGIHVEMRGTASGCGVFDTPFAMTYNGE